MTKPDRVVWSLFATLFALLGASSSAPAAALLPSWNNGPAKHAILEFVAAVTKEGAPRFIASAERIAVFDNDGTLWAEQPIYFQFAFVFDRIKVLAPQHPEWKTKQPYKAVLDGDMKALAASGGKGVFELMAATHTGMTTEQFSRIVAEWVAKVPHPRTRHAYAEMVYQPMLELLAYLRDNEFKTFVVSRAGASSSCAYSPSVCTAFRPSESSAPAAPSNSEWARTASPS